MVFGIYISVKIGYDVNMRQKPIVLEFSIKFEFSAHNSVTGLADTRKITR